MYQQLRWTRYVPSPPCSLRIHNTSSTPPFNSLQRPAMRVHSILVDVPSPLMLRTDGIVDGPRDPQVALPEQAVLRTQYHLPVRKAVTSRRLPPSIWFLVQPPLLPIRPSFTRPRTSPRHILPFSQSVSQPLPRPPFPSLPFHPTPPTHPQPRGSSFSSSPLHAAMTLSALHISPSFRFRFLRACIHPTPLP